LVGRQRLLVAALQIASWVGLAAAFVGLVGPGEVRDLAAGVFVGVVVGTPFGRLVWLMVRWIRRGDPRFAVAAGALLTVVALAASTAWW